MTTASAPRRLRSRAWFDDRDNTDMTALYLERYMNFGLSLEELQSGRPIVGIAQTGSDLSPCNRHHLVLAERVRGRHTRRGRRSDRIPGPSHPGDRQAPDGGTRSQSRLSRPRRGSLRLSDRRRGADHRLRQDPPACLMAAATVDIPAIALSVGPMISGWAAGKRIGSGAVVWKARERFAAGEIDRRAVHQARCLGRALHRLLQHDGHRHDDEQPGRGARHVAAGNRPPFRRRIATARNAPTRRGGASSR